MDWSKPKEVKDIDLAFGGRMEDLLPSEKEIPKEFHKHDGTKWNKIVSHWFFRGLPNDAQIIPKDGIDVKIAVRHMQAIMKSRAPKHEHKEAGVAYLMSLWIEDIIIPEKAKS